MIGSKTTPAAALEKALAAIDFSADNAELQRLKAELANAVAKDGQVRTEAGRLANEASAYSGPQPDAVAAAILEGRSLEDATRVSPTKEDLIARRDALFSSLEPLRQRADDLRRQIAETEGRSRTKAVEAARPYVAHLTAQQVQAAETICAADAAMMAIKQTLRCYLPGEKASKLAREGVTGTDSLLNWRDVLQVPEDVITALRPLSGRSDAIGGVPETVATR